MWQVHTDRAGCFPRAGVRRRRRCGPKGGEEPAFNQASTCDVGGEQLYQESRGIYTGHFMQIQPFYLQSSQTLFTTARLPKLDQAANHNNLLKRPEGPEAATSSLGGGCPGRLHRRTGPSLGPWRHSRPPDTQSRPPGAYSLSPSVWVATSPGNRPPSPKATEKEKSFLSSNVHVYSPREGF